MKLSKLIWPLISIASVVMITISLFLTWWVKTYTTDSVTVSMGSVSAFSDYSGLESSILSTLGLICLILGAVGIILSIVLSFIKLAGKKASFKNLFLVATILALVGTIGFLAFETIFSFANVSIEFMSTTTEQLAGQFGLWMALGALVIGTISVFACKKDFKAKKATKKHSKKRK